MPEIAFRALQLDDRQNKEKFHALNCEAGEA